MNAAKAAVAEDGDNIAWAGGGGDVSDDFLDVGEVGGASTCSGDVGGEECGVEALGGGDFMDIGQRCDDSNVCGGEGGCEFFLKNVALRGVGAWLEKNPQSGFWIALADGLDGKLNGGGVVGEIVDDFDAIDFAAEFLAAGYAIEGLEASAALFW